MATTRVRISEALDDFIAEQEYKGNRPATIHYYRSNLDRFTTGTGVIYLDELDEARVRTWLLSHRKLSPNTIATYDRSIRVFAGWLHRRGYLTSNPLATLPKPRGKSMEIVTFTHDEVRAMIAHAKSRRQPMRDVALLTLLLDTGLRIGEATSLRLAQINWQGGWLTVDGKTGERSVPFGHKSKRALRRYIDLERKASAVSEQTVFLARGGRPMRVGTATHHVIRIAKAVKVAATKLGPHTFRHTFAVEFIRNGGDAFTLQRLLGHSTLDMTRRYVHLAKSDLAAAHKRFGPADKLL